jgi:protein TonB
MRAIPPGTCASLPVYPSTAMAAREEGQVILQLRISADGQVLEARVDSSSGYADLDEEAVRSIRS